MWNRWSAPHPIGLGRSCCQLLFFNLSLTSPPEPKNLLVSHHGVWMDPYFDDNALDRVSSTRSHLPFSADFSLQLTVWMYLNCCLDCLWFRLSWQFPLSMDLWIRVFLLDFSSLVDFRQLNGFECIFSWMVLYFPVLRISHVWTVFIMGSHLFCNYMKNRTVFWVCI